MSGELTVRDFDMDVTFTPTTAAVHVQPNLKNPVSVWLSAYEVRGVPVTAGVPNDHDYYLRIGPLPANPRINVANSPTYDSVPLHLTGEVSYTEYKYPIQTNNAYNGDVNNLTFTLTRPDGTPAIYDQCTLYLTIRTSSQSSTLAKVISQRPAVNDILNFVARPYST